MRRHPSWLRRPRIAIFLMLLGNGTAFADLYSLKLIPLDGNIEGAPGSTIGWGYSITNDSSSDWLVTDSVNAGSWSHATPLSIFDLPILAPGVTVTETFDPTTPLGFYGLTWDADAPLGFTNSGTFDLSAEWWDGDPFAGGSFIEDAADATAAYSATTVATPEPPAMVFVSTELILALASCLLFKRGVIPRRQAAPNTDN